MFRGAVRGDLPQILQIYAHAREAMAASGNPTQWGDNFPPQELLEEDIDSNRLFVDVVNGQLLGVFAFIHMRVQTPLAKLILQIILHGIGALLLGEGCCIARILLAHHLRLRPQGQLALRSERVLHILRFGKNADGRFRFSEIQKAVA